MSSWHQLSCDSLGDLPLFQNTSEPHEALDSRTQLFPLDAACLPPHQEDHLSHARSLNYLDVRSWSSLQYSLKLEPGDVVNWGQVSIFYLVVSLRIYGVHGGKFSLEVLKMNCSASRKQWEVQFTRYQ